MKNPLNIDFGKLRKDMVENAIFARGVRSELVLSAMRNVPRESFLPAQLREFAYEDAPLPIEEGQTISQPYIVAFMTEALALRGGEKVLEIGTGSGYAAAVLSEIAADVYTIERHGALADNSPISRPMRNAFRFCPVEIADALVRLAAEVDSRLAQRESAVP
jgi:protein-L-isoaspartate(D-aspartate) O-methyltransferase